MCRCFGPAWGSTQHFAFVCECYSVISNSSLYHGCLFLRGSLAAPDARISSRSREKRSLHRGYIGEPTYILTTPETRKSIVLISEFIRLVYCISCSFMTSPINRALLSQEISSLPGNQFWLWPQLKRHFSNKTNQISLSRNVEKCSARWRHAR